MSARAELEQMAFVWEGRMRQLVREIERETIERHPGPPDLVLQDLRRTADQFLMAVQATVQLAPEPGQVTLGDGETYEEKVERAQQLARMQQCIEDQGELQREILKRLEVLDRERSQMINRINVQTERINKLQIRLVEVEGMVVP